MKGTAQAYGESWYWDKRYTDGAAGPFECYQKYPGADAQPTAEVSITQTTPQPLRPSQPSCPHCRLRQFCEGMVDDGYEDVVNVDISSVVIEAMQKKYSDRPQLKYMKMDTRDMSCFEGGSFDGVVDKGTLDSILCGQSSQQNAAKMLSEVGRLHMECQFSDSHC
ncbi:uncharacterized protein LOC132613808 isoform X1 [Lycium barbarum]|uniref:uncharacterized protein LOC132613808 isoform X1 n=1 Tax=Lycium barbarum TaxID=112863 RepID=UPI00293EA1AA|nr:uncharacterized protein LOC132613808 isoform X1 [Lycium barbarum]